MKLKKPKHLGWIVTGLVVIGFVIVSLMPTARVLDWHTVEHGALVQTIDAEGQTHYVATYLVSMPSTGTITAITVQPGDSVRAGQVIATYTPPEMDARQRSSAVERANAASTMETEAKQRLASLQPLVEQAQRRAERTARLVKSGAVSKEQAENARDAFEQITSEYAAATARVATSSYEVKAARAAAAAAPGQRVPIEAPMDGVVLRRFEDHARLMTAGMPLIEIAGDGHVEVVIDVLSTDAVRVRPGMPVFIEGWGGADTLKARVITVEPAARVKISTLGVEEKRVDVIAALIDPPPVLGDAYKVDARIVVWQTPRAVVIPLSTLFRDNGEWFVFIRDGKHIHKRPVTIGHQASLLAEVLSGLQDNDVIVMHPPEDLEDGTLVE